MKKKLLSAILVLCMVLALLPNFALASAPPPNWKEGLSIAYDDICGGFTSSEVTYGEDGATITVTVDPVKLNPNAIDAAVNTAIMAQTAGSGSVKGDIYGESTFSGVTDAYPGAVYKDSYMDWNSFAAVDATRSSDDAKDSSPTKTWHLEARSQACVGGTWKWVGQIDGIDATKSIGDEIRQALGESVEPVYNTNYRFASRAGKTCYYKVHFLDENFVVLGTVQYKVVIKNDLTVTSAEDLIATVAVAQSGDTITLGDNITLTDTLAINGKTLTLDLNGKTLTCSPGENKTAINIGAASASAITLKDSAGGGKITSSALSEGYNLIAVRVGSTLNYQSGTLEVVKEEPAVPCKVIQNQGTLTITGGSIIANDNTGIFNASGGTVSFKDCSITAAGGTGISAAGSNVTVESGTITAADGIFASKTMTVNFEGGAINATNAGIIGNGSAGEGGTIINVSAGIITSDSTGIYHPQSGTLNISGTASVSGYANGIGIKSGNLNISGGRVSCTGSNTAPTDGWSNGINGSGAAIQIESNSDYSGGVNVSITGGTVASANGSSIYEYIGKGTETAVADFGIIDAKLEGGIVISSQLAAAAGRPVITAGDFTHDPTAYVAEGKYVTASTVSGYSYAVTNVPEDIKVAPPEIKADSILPATPTEGITANDIQLGADAATAAADTEIDENDANALSILAANSAITADNKIDTGDGAKAVSEIITAANEDGFDTLTWPSAAPDSSPNYGPVVVVQPYMDIKVVEADADNNTLTLDITPMSQVLVTKTYVALGNDPLVAGTNAIAVGEPQKLTVTEAVPVTLKVGIPADMARETSVGSGEYFPLTIKHQKDNGQIYYYEAAVTFDDPAYFAEFTVTHGFSKFAIGAYDERYACVGYWENDDSVLDKEYDPTDVNVAEFPGTTPPPGQYQTGWNVYNRDEELITTLPCTGKLTDAQLDTLSDAYSASNNQLTPEELADVEESEGSVLFWYLEALPVFAYYPPPSTNPTLTFEVNGGSAIAPVSKASGTVVDLKGYVPTRTGYNFIGWYADSALKEKTASVTLDKNVTVYAKWLKTNSMENFILSGTYSGFDDVDESKWYGTEQEGTVRDGVRLGIIIGYGNGKFGPDDELKIGEAIKIAAMVYSTYSGDGFEFAQGKPWYQVYVDYAIAKGIIKAGDFADYTAICTRAEAAYIFSKALPESELDKISSLTPPDVAETDKYGKEIYLLYAAGILRGNDAAGTFGGGGAFTRAQASGIITRLAMPGTRK